MGSLLDCSVFLLFVSFVFSHPSRFHRSSRHHLNYFGAAVRLGKQKRVGPGQKHTRGSQRWGLFSSRLPCVFFLFLFLSFLFDFFCCGKQKAHACGLEIYGGILRTNLAVRSLLGSEGFLFRFGIGLRDLVSEILWAEKSKPASQGPTGECSRA